MHDRASARGGLGSALGARVRSAAPDDSASDDAPAIAGDDGR